MKIRHLRWWLCGLMFVATGLSFLDRQVLSVVAPAVTVEFHMSNEQYSYVTTGFLASYAVMFFLAGRIMDTVGTRLGMTLSVGLWSIASALHAVARNALQLGIFRFLLGAGEGGCFPGVTKGATDWFPPRQRALAIGIAIGGSALGGVVAPPMTVWLVGLAGWRGAFLATGLIGATWVALWWIFYHAPESSPFVSDEERALIQPRCLTDEAAQRAAAPQAPPPSVLELLRRRDVWGLSLMRFLVDPVFYFYMFWIPKYLAQERGLSLAEIGRLTWIPFLALGVSNILGGWVSDRLISAGIPASKARKLVMAAAAGLTVSSSLAAYPGSAGTAVAIMSLLMFAHGFWITNYVTVITEICDKNSVATVMGLSGMAGTVGGMLANTSIGWIADRYSFLPIWIASGCMYPLALVVLLLTVRSERQHA
jgi:ACS family hexuronate transporter-like MFS transporter